MAESISSLRIYFVLTGAMGAYHATGPLTSAAASSVETIDGALRILVAFALVIVGLMLRSFLPARVMAVRVLLFVSIVFQFIALVSVLLVDPSESTLVFPLVLLGLNWYLLVSANRFAAKKTG